MIVGWPASLARPGSLFLIAALTASLAGCSTDPESRKRAYFESAERYVAAKQYDEAIVEYRNALQQDPQFAEARFKLAEAYVAKNDYRNAYPEYIRAADLMPDDLRVQTRAGTMLLLGRRFDEARARARQILQKDPSNLNGLILLGNALAGLGDLSNAVQIAERAVAANPKRDGTRVNLGALQLASGNEQEAEEAFTTAVRLNPRSTSAHLALANFYQAVGKVDLAEESLQRALALAPQDIRTNRALAAFYIGSGKPAQAEGYLRGIAERSNEPSSWSDLADYYAQQGRDKDAVAILDKLAADPKQFASARRRAAVIAHTAGRKSEAHEILSDLVKRSPGDAETQTIRANLLFADSRSDEALDAARGAARLNARSAAAHLILGRILISRGEFEPGRRALAEAVNLDPRVLEARLALGSLHLSAGEVEPAIEVVTAAVDSHPDSIEPRLLLARALLVRPEDRPKALAQAEATVKAFPARQPRVIRSARITLRRGTERPLDGSSSRHWSSIQSSSMRWRIWSRWKSPAAAPTRPATSSGNSSPGALTIRVGLL